MSATDRDLGVNGEVRYRLLYVVDVNSKFVVSEQTGSITTSGPLDFEQIRQHVLYIKASDSGTPALSCKFIELKQPLQSTPFIADTLGTASYCP